MSAAPRRGLLVAVVVLGCIAAGAGVRAVAARFDRADRRAAEGMVRDFRTGHGALVDVICEGTAIAPSRWDWHSAMVSTIFRHVRVSVSVPRAMQEPEAFDFDVDLGERSIHPGNPPAERALRTLLAP